MRGFVSRKKGARSMGEEKKEEGKKKKLTGKINMKKKEENKHNITIKKTYHNVGVSNVSACMGVTRNDDDRV